MQSNKGKWATRTKNWKHGPGASIRQASFAFLETPTQLLIKSQVRSWRKRKGKLWHIEQIGSHGANWYPVTIYDFMTTIQKLCSDDFNLVATYPALWKPNCKKSRSKQKACVVRQVLASRMSCGCCMKTPYAGA